MAKKRPQPQARTKDRDGVFLWIAFIAYAAITLWVGLHHEPWRDEADPWLLMRDGDMSKLLTYTGFIGMPGLWYLMLFPFARFGAPYLSMTLLHLALAWGAAFIFLRYAPFPRWIRVLFVFSYYAAYEYAVVARPYGPMVLLLFAALAAWRHRDEKPILMAVCVALLANTATHGLFMAALLGALFLGETFVRKRLGVRSAQIAIAIMIIGGALSALQLWPPANAPKGHYLRTVDIGSVAWAFGNAFLPGLGMWIPFAISVVAMAIITMAIGRRWVPQIFMWGSLLSLSAIYALVWVAGYRHSGLILVSIIAALWLATFYEPASERWTRAVHVVLGISLLYCVAVSVKYWNFDLREPFTGAREMAEFIKANGLDKYEIATHVPTASEALLPYLPDKQFYYIIEERHGTFLRWDDLHNKATRTNYGTAVGMAIQKFAGQQWLLMVNTKMQDPERYGFRLIFTNLQVPFEKFDERYWLYAPVDWPGPPLPEVLRR